MLGKSLAKELDATPGKIDLKRFASGECYVRFGESVRGHGVYLLQAPGKQPDESLMELMLMCQAAKLSFASTVHVILPYFPYARQDRVSEPREPISARLIADLLQTAGADHVMTIHLHSDQVQGFFSIPVDALNVRPLFVEYFRKKLKSPIVVSPDIGGAKQAKKFADHIGAELAILHKTRSAHNKAEVIDIVGNVEGRTCIIYDDIIDTAGTLVAAKQTLIEHGAHKDMYVAATHGLFSGPAIDRLKEAAFKEVVITDSIPQAETFSGLNILPIAPMLAQVINHIERKESVTDIYKH